MNVNLNLVPVFDKLSKQFKQRFNKSRGNLSGRFKILQVFPGRSH